jgi:hypothetical protein
MPARRIASSYGDRWHQMDQNLRLLTFLYNFARSQAKTGDNRRFWGRDRIDCIHIFFVKDYFSTPLDRRLLLIFFEKNN